MTISDRAYPTRWERHIVLGTSWRIFVRPLKPDDEGLIRDLLVHVNKEDLRLRFFDSIKEFSPEFIARLTQLDYARAIAFVAIDETSRDTLGVVRLHGDETRTSGEFAILLRSALKGRGLGWYLMQMIIEYANAEGFKRIEGQILHENTVMLKMCRELGFGVKTHSEDRGLCDVTLTLEDPKETIAPVCRAICRSSREGRTIARGARCLARMGSAFSRLTPAHDSLAQTAALTFLSVSTNASGENDENNAAENCHHGRNLLAYGITKHLDHQPRVQIGRRRRRTVMDERARPSLFKRCAC